MKAINKKFLKQFLSAVVFLFAAFFTKQSFAVCPVCVVAVGAGIGFSRWLGIDDIISGLWIGAFTLALIFWTKEILEKKKINFRGQTTVVVIFWYLLTLVSLWWLGFLKEGIIYSFWLSKILLGIVIGSIVFWTSVEWHYYLKFKNGGRVYFPFQKVILPLALLIVLSLVFYFLGL